MFFEKILAYPLISEDYFSCATRGTCDEIIFPKLPILGYIYFLFVDVKKLSSSPLKRGHYSTKFYFNPTRQLAIGFSVSSIALSR